MKIALVSQPIDRILPPVQTSIGACTYGLARSLVPDWEVVIYARKDLEAHRDAAPVFIDGGVEYRFISSPRIDLLLERLFPKYRDLVHRVTGRRPPWSTSPWFYPGYGRRVAKDLQHQNCDFIQLQHSSQYIRPIWAHNRRSKIVLQIQAEWFPQCHPHLIKRRLRHLDLLVGGSAHITRQALRLFPSISNRYDTILDAIDPVDFTPKPAAEKQASPTKRLLYVGAISPHKGIHVLVEAFNEVIRSFPDVRLDIVGVHFAYALEEVFSVDDPEMMAKMRPLYSADYSAYLNGLLSSEAAERVTFTGAVPRARLLEYYRDADIFVFPSVWNEGFGIPPVEAMAAGVAVVASRIGALPETIVDGETGILVEPYDPSVLAATILRLLKDDELRLAMGKKGRRRAIETFTWDRAAREVQKRYPAL